MQSHVEVRVFDIEDIKNNFEFETCSKLLQRNYDNENESLESFDEVKNLINEMQKDDNIFFLFDIF